MLFCIVFQFRTRIRAPFGKHDADNDKEAAEPADDAERFVKNHNGCRSTDNRLYGQYECHTVCSDMLLGGCLKDEAKC